MSEFFELIWKLIDLVLRFLDAASDYTPPRRKRVFSFGFVMFLLLVAVVELVVLQAFLGGNG
ncbi:MULTISPECIES: hypothetical protein [Pseudomonas]|uniref:hypothetical protein n=1 Tax=Pseudomonas TaxID=286 RepID=UPI001C65CF39|nr:MULTISPECIES: hypothetical protein [unclassified Pseudomonas]MBW8127567.1 hypothetical protein [Pseudomonas sp. LAP_36]MBW8139343.1 hypothetical protein [Pseudomonas sp. PAMC 26818]